MRAGRHSPQGAQFDGFAHGVGRAGVTAAGDVGGRDQPVIRLLGPDRRHNIEFGKVGVQIHAGMISSI